MLNRTVLKEFQESNLKSFSDGQININFPDENDLTKVDVVLTPTGGLYNGGTFVFAVNLPTNYPDAVASISCRTKIFHPNIDFSGYICFNLLNDEWNPDVRLIDYAHGLLWLLYQPNLGSRLNGAVPNDQSEYAELVHKSLQGKTVAGVTFPPMIPAEPEPVEEYPQQSVAAIVAMFNAPHPPPPPPVGFRMRIPTTTVTTTAPVTLPITGAPVVVIDTTAPAPPAPPTAEQLRAQAPRPAADTRQADAEAEAEAEAEEEEKEEEVVMPAEPRAGRQVRALRRSSERVAELSRTAAASPRRQRHAGPNQEKQSRNQPSSTTKPQQHRRGKRSAKKTQTKRRASANA